MKGLILRPGGVLFVFDPYAAEGETREAFLRRWWSGIQSTCTKLSPEELKLVHDHISACDFPESPAPLGDFAHKAGFARTETPWKSPDGFYVLFAFHA